MPTHPQTLDTVGAYHGDTTPLTGQITVRGLDLSGEVTAHLEIRAIRGEGLVATVVLDAQVVGDALVIAPVVLNGSVWAAWPRTLAEAAYDIEVRTPLRVRTVARGSIDVTLDVTRS